MVVDKKKIMGSPKSLRCILGRPWISVLNGWQWIQQLRYFNQNQTGQANGSMLRQGISKVFRVHPLGPMTLCTKFPGNASNICWNISVWTKMVDQPTLPILKALPAVTLTCKTHGDNSCVWLELAQIDFSLTWMRWLVNPTIQPDIEIPKVLICHTHLHATSNLDP